MYCFAIDSSSTWNGSLKKKENFSFEDRFSLGLVIKREMKKEKKKYVRAILPIQGLAFESFGTSFFYWSYINFKILKATNRSRYEKNNKKIQLWFIATFETRKTSLNFDSRSSFPLICNFRSDHIWFYT